MDAIGFDPIASHCILYDFPTDKGIWSYLIRTAEGPTKKKYVELDGIQSEFVTIIDHNFAIVLQQKIGRLILVLWIKLTHYIGN